jgi:outer membrane protein assembly factor BamB
VSRKTIAAAAAVVLALLVGLGIALVLYRDHLSHGVQGSSTVEFQPRQAPKPPHIRGAIEWPEFGFGPIRAHVGPSNPVRPPFRVQWVAGGNSLLEFPPAIGYGRLFAANAAGQLFALNTRTGARAWTFATKRCVAASPAIGRAGFGTIYESFLSRQPCGGAKNADGEVVAVSVGAGTLRWRRRIGPTETSPLLDGNSLYVGDWNGKVYALNAQNGQTRWAFSTGGAVKGGAAISGNRLFIGSYDGHVYALNAHSGRLIWRASSDPRLFGHGTFYSTPAVGYGRVYIGSTDGRVYSYGATTGRRRWSYVTGGYVYGSPALWNNRVFVGSYDHYFYALDAATGKLVWRFHADGPISGSATVLNGLVYFATLAGHTYALDSRTGRQVWAFHDGKYASVTTEGKRLFLVGYAKVYGLVPLSKSRPTSKNHAARPKKVATRETRTRRTAKKR